MPPNDSVPSFDEMIQSDRQRRKNEALANEIFSRGRKSNLPALNGKRKPGTGPSLASRVGVTKISQRSASSTPILGPGRDKSRAHGAHEPLNPRIMSRHTQIRNTVATNQEPRSPVINVPARPGGKGMTIRGLAGPCVVIASNFAPGTTSADIQSAMIPLGGEMQSCRILTSSPTVMAEMVFIDKGGAEIVIATFNNQKADGRVLHVYMKQGPSTPAPIFTPPTPAPIQAIPTEPKAPHEPRAFYPNDTHSNSFRNNAGGERNGKRAEPDFQDGRYGFDVREDIMDVEMGDTQGNRREDRSDERKDIRRGRYAGRGRDDRGLYSDDLYSHSRGRGFR